MRPPIRRMPFAQKCANGLKNKKTYLFMRNKGKDKNQLAEIRRSDITKFNNADSRSAETGKKRFGFDFSYLFSALLVIAVALASFGLVLYFGYHFVDILTPDVTTAPAYDITESEYRRATGYIFRSEQVLADSISGTPDYKTDDGERVGIDEVLCDVYAAITDEVRQRIEEIDREIALLEASIGTGVVQTGLPEALADANSSYSEIMKLLSRGEYRDAAALSDSFLVALNRINLLENGADEAKVRIDTLKSEKSSLIASYGKKISTVTSESVGYFFRDCDGYEEIFDPALLGNITVGGFAELISGEPEDIGGAVGKMIDDPKWYLCVPLGSADAKGFAEGNVYNIIFNDNGARTLPMTLERLVLDFDDHDGDGDRAEALLVFFTKEMPKDFTYLRLQDVSIEFASYSGYRIPLTAVRYYDGMTGVYTLVGGYVFFRQIDVIYEGNGYLIAADYADAEPGKPLTYTALGFSDYGKFDDYASLHALAEEQGWEKKIYDNGGIPVVKGQTLRYFYHLDDLEQVILTGKDLYHGKALD